MKEKRKADPTRISKVIDLCIANHCRHISKPTLKRMGLSILYNKTSAYESNIYTVYVNPVVSRFLTTVIKLEDNPKLVHRPRKSTTQYQVAP